MMRILYAVFFVCLLSTAFAEAAQASLLIRVDRSEQRMRVYIDGELYYVWPVSTGRRGYSTPTGSYRPYVLKRFHRSSKYDDAPMPYSIFYRGGYAIHGTGAVRRLGRPASHGCIRLHTANARQLFRMVNDFGKASTRIVIHR
jgi:lipoprotein-anchoring transpeptidase ErfK/SrfK